MKKIIFILRVVVAIILVQTLYFKFTAHPDSVYIFSTVGLEPFGRIGIGIAELIAALLIMIPRTVWLGAGMSLGIISGAIFMHLTQLGVEVNGDGGTLFFLAVAVFVSSAVVLWTEKENIPFLSKLVGKEEIREKELQVNV
ncbi:MAG: DoxX family protein [Bacteroidota bacterium]